MASIAILLRSSANGREYKGSLVLRLIHQRRVKVMTIPYKIHQYEWHSATQTINFKQAKEDRLVYLNAVSDQLAYLKASFEEIIINLERKGRFSLDDILYGYRTRIDTGNMLCFVEKLAADLIHMGQERTARAYRTVANRLIQFNKGKDIPLKHINPCLIRDLEKEMKCEGKSLNTISFYMRNLRAIYNKAVSEEKIKETRENPFTHVFTGFQRTKKRALDLNELCLLSELAFCDILDENSDRLTYKNPIPAYLSDLGLYMAWRIFFFCFHARGMCFVDMAYLRKENIRKGIITYYRKKTGQQMEVTITPVLLKIINSFSDDVRFSPYVFPIIKDAVKPERTQYESALHLQNVRLKRLCKEAGLSKMISTHVSRHSWATIAKRENLPLWVISEGLGHSNEKTTYTYLASFDQSVLDRANDVILDAMNRNKGILV